jgi:hypothetical protein
VFASRENHLIKMTSASHPAAFDDPLSPLQRCGGGNHADIIVILDRAIASLRLAAAMTMKEQRRNQTQSKKGMGRRFGALADSNLALTDDFHVHAGPAE